MNGGDSKNSIHVRVCRWTAGVADYIWMALKKPLGLWRGAAWLCKSGSHLEAATLERWIEWKNAEGRMGWRAEDESDTRRPDAHTRKPTLIVCDQFSICLVDQSLDLAIRRVLLLSSSPHVWVVQQCFLWITEPKFTWLMNRPHWWIGFR